ncbi:MAG: DUF2064 domain-containing protein [Thiobacillus sp.]|nr:DUF2064 domain-containing protein [Thiobacillus sp.]
MTTAIAIFMKTPGLSPIKTRLAAGIGAEKTLEFYSLCVGAVKATVGAVNASVFCAVAEEEAVDSAVWNSSPVLYTGEGDLGERQHHIYSTLLMDYDNVLLIGADTPQLSSSHLEAAIATLHYKDFVVGPARDGGYYLFGGRVALDRSIWISVPWSTSATLERLEAALPSTPRHLPMLTDADRADDLKHVLSEMPSAPHERQRDVLEWIRRNTSLAVE